MRTLLRDSLAMAGRLEVAPEGFVGALGAAVREPIQALQRFAVQNGVARVFEFVNRWDGLLSAMQPRSGT